jgi:hypothetical protein
MKKLFVGLAAVVMMICMAGTALAVPSKIDFRVRSGNSGFEATIMNPDLSTDNINWGFIGAWSNTSYAYTVGWDASTGTATFWSDAGFNLTRTWSGLADQGPGTIMLVGKDSEAASNVAMSVTGGPSFASSLSPGWLTEQGISVANIGNFTISGFFNFTGDSEAGSAENLKAQIEIRDFKTPTVPEPATMLLLGLGLMGIAGIRRKFKG